jgi:quinol monooxygenase YgiN
MRTTPGDRDKVVAILLRDVDELKAAGCDLYLVALSDADPDVIHVTEVWASKDHHAASLQLPATRAAIAEAMPMLTGDFTSDELTVAGGLGI